MTKFWHPFGMLDSKTLPMLAASQRPLAMFSDSSGIHFAKVSDQRRVYFAGVPYEFLANQLQLQELFSK